MSVTITRLACGECGGTFAGDWEIVECRKCGHQIRPTLDLELDWNEVATISATGILSVITRED